MLITTHYKSYKSNTILNNGNLTALKTIETTMNLNGLVISDKLFVRVIETICWNTLGEQRSKGSPETKWYIPQI